MTNNQIVARYQDGRLLKGIALDIDPARPTFHVRPAPGKALTVKLAELKAVFSYVPSLVIRTARRICGPVLVMRGPERRGW
jgi:hypothetical protein